MTEQINSFGEQTPLLTYATDETQLASAMSFIDSIQSYSKDLYKRNYIDKARTFLSKKDCRSDVAIRVAISCFDYCLSDEIREYAGDLPLFTDSGAVYFRSDVYKTIFPNVILETVSKNPKMDSSNILIASQAHIQNCGLTGTNCGMLTPDLAFVSGSSLNKPEPPVGIARQEVYRSLLRCGVNPLSINTIEANTVDQGRSETFYQRKYRRKSFVSLEAESDKLESWRKRTEKHWGRLLGNGNSKAVLFSSGTSANEAVMLALKDCVDCKACVYPNWYYENNLTANNTFENKTHDPANVDVLLLNLEPTNYFRLDNVEESSLEAIRLFVSSAMRNPNKKKYLVIDSTVNPLFSLKDLGFDEIPTNIVLIKTVSATKHQDGGRNYFFGAVWSNDSELLTEIQALRGGVGGDLHESHIVHFPRPTASTLRERRETVHEANKSLASLVNKETGWRIAPNSYHSFIFPPEDLIKQIVDFGKTVSNEELEARVKAINDKLFGIIAETVLNFKNGEIEMGDSFGLPQTRISIQGGFNTVDGATFRLKIPRICPGYSVDRNHLNFFVKQLIERLAKVDRL